MTFTCILFGIITGSILYVNGQATELRLGNVTGLELKPYEGPIEVFEDGEWGAIIRHGVDNVTAKTVCKILGYGYTGFRVDKFQYTGQPILSRLKCAGHETSIVQCQQEAETALLNRTAYDAPGVHCFDHVFSEVRLSGGKKATEGMVQVKMDGRWGRVCSNDQSSGTKSAPNVSLAICRTLGFQNYDLQNSFKADDYDGVELSWLDLNYLSCTEGDTYFSQCAFQDATIYQPGCYSDLVIGCITTLSQYCSSDDICAGVENAICFDAMCVCKEGYLQIGPRQCSAAYTFRLFYTSELYNEGLVEVNTSGQWSLITQEYLTFNDVTSKVLCQTLGFGFVGFSTWMYYYSELDYNGYLAYKVFECSGLETDATECFDNVWYQIEVKLWHPPGLSNRTPVTRLHCYDSRINDIRLKGGLVPHEGRLEVRIGEKWGTVCYTTLFSDWFPSTDEVCKLLGYAENGNLNPSKTSDESLEVWLNGLDCEAYVSDINDCSYDLGDAVGGCSFFQDELGLYCSPLRLVDGASKNSGRIEAGLYGKLHTICADDFSITTANVSCKLLGYSDVVDVTALPEPFDGEIKMLNSTVECNGTETSLEHCNISISSDFTCHSGKVAGVKCLSPLDSYCQVNETCAGVIHSTCENYICGCKHGYMSSGDRNCSAKNKFRFVQDTSNDGLIEMNINNTWALVTGSSVPFSDQTSRILCATLGYGYTGFSTVSITDMNLTYTGYVWNNMIECTGTESYATECIYGAWDAQQQTRWSYLTRLHCFEYLVRDLRLQGGVLPNEGRLEVNIGGRWGTVCVNEKAYGSGESRLSFNVSEDLSGTTEVWMSYPRCNATDKDINDCSIIKGVIEGCNSHTYDLQLKCDQCSAGNFGQNCSSTCSCNTDNTITSPDGRKCDEITGACPCNEAWSGISCINDVNECLNSTICQGQNIQCKNTVGGYECICLQGYERQNEEGCIQVASSNDTMMLVIILSSVVVGLTLVIILFTVCFCQYRRKNKGAADTMDKPVNGNSNRNVLTTSIRYTVKEEVYDYINDVTDTIDANALQVTKNKDDGYLDIDLVNRNDQAQSFENGVMPDQVNEYLDLNAVEQTLQEGYDYPYKGYELPERGYVVGRVGRKLPETPENSSITGKEGTKDPYSQLKHQKLHEHMYERMADDHGYLKPVRPGNLTSSRL